MFLLRIVYRLPWLHIIDFIHNTMTALGTYCTAEQYPLTHIFIHNNSYSKIKFKDLVNQNMKQLYSYLNRMLKNCITKYLFDTKKCRWNSVSKRSPIQY